MKPSLPALQTSSQEECGVWLDTVQLKGKAKKKRVTRPISKLLNPFTEGGGYNLAVALNFTQTKMEMPKTKQSSISTFFTSQRRVLNKMSISEVSTTDPQETSASTPVTTDIKKDQYADLRLSDLCYSGEGLVGATVDYVTGPEAVVCWKKDEVKHTPSESEEEQCEELKPPQRKKKFSKTALVLAKSDPTPHNCHQDHLMTCSQENDGGVIRQETSVMKFSESDPGFLSSLQSEAEHGSLVNVAGITSTQKSLKDFQLSQMDDDKENSNLLLSKSPKKRSTLSPLKPFTDYSWIEPKLVSPRKHIPDQLWKRAHNRENCISGQLEWTKSCSSPLKRQPSNGHEDSLAMLFTQDSEGFMVITHRGPHARSLLKDQSNFNESYSEKDEEEDMLFTQDSQGNLVIKH